MPRNPMTAHNIRVPDPLWSAVKAKAEAEGLHVSEAIRKIMQEYTEGES